jgi:hypothetical protein
MQFGITFNIENLVIPQWIFLFSNTMEIVNEIECVSDCCLNPKRTICQLYNGEKTGYTLIQWWFPLSIRRTSLIGFIYWKLTETSERGFDTLFWFRANQHLLLPLNATCLAGKQQISIWYWAFGLIRGDHQTIWYYKWYISKHLNGHSCSLILRIF